ncbi:GATA zinc finger domain containing 2Ab isoform X1 [Tachysurus fulvidraco]|uniref:GATA zinc finger domain containing 2Ab isoform X1 n=2 Tax=Tachysurus fulvidraco TaxID=1234273 RepID=UPI000F50DC07|nr:GATA zinc finger domain containing 2Ab isoform X1 [Tachysurus fulvidraco]
MSKQRPAYLATGEAAGRAAKGSPGILKDLQGAKMSEEVVRQTRSQKRALEREVPALDGDTKRVKLERGELDSSKVANILKAGEVKATIKVEVEADEEPVDMRTPRSEIKKERPPTPDDVIVLSDNEPGSPQINGISHSLKKTDTEMLMKISPEERQRFIKQLKEELRLQEAKLVLLKKLRQSQIQKESVVQKTTNSTSNPPPLVRGSISSSKAPLQVSSNRSSGTVIPPPLVRGVAQVSKHTSISMPPLVRGSQPIAVTPQQIATLRQQQHSGSGPPPLLLGPRTSVPNVQVQGQRIIQQGLIRVANVANTNVLVNIPQGSPTGLKGSSVSSQSGIGTNASTVNANDSPASRQAAAKLALRKQLEKTLLDIPPPKPPAPELNFLPSAANNEFIYLVGLEMVVQNLLDFAKNKQQTQQDSSPEAPPAKEPFTCAQCHTDFTSRWRQDKSNSSILCEQCMSSNQKKVLKAEHTTRLKAAFVKALQQEQEIEQRILQQSSSSSPKSSAASSSLSSSPVMKSEQHVLVSSQYKTGQSSLTNRATAVNRYHSSTIKQSPGQVVRNVPQAVVSVNSRGMSRNFSTSSQLQNAVRAATLVSRPGKHAGRAGPNSSSSSRASGSSSSKAATNVWRRQSNTSTGVTMAYVNPSLSVLKATSPADRQREYLLDMIPSRSISHTANNWK